MTKYRKISNGHWDFLQYRKEKKILWLFSYHKWEYVWKPYYDKIWGRGLDCSGTKGYVNSLNCNLTSFINKWTNIEDYFQEAKKEQTLLEDKANKYHKDLQERKGVVGEIKFTWYN